MGWAIEELGNSHFGDRRFTKRLCSMVERFAEHPATSIPRSFDTWPETKAAYRLFASSKVTPEAILQAHAESTARRAEACTTVLNLSDKTELNYNSLEGTSGLGHLSHRDCRGIMVHTGLAVTPDGEILGVVYQKQFVRPFAELGKKYTRAKRDITEKESYRWIEEEQAALAVLGQKVRVITIADREADIYELFISPRSANAELLVRAKNRRVTTELSRLKPTVEAAAVLARFEIEVPRNHKQSSRKAIIELRACTANIAAPESYKSRHRAAGIPNLELTAVLATEVNPPSNEGSISWLLLTTLKVTSSEQAIEVVGFYSRRWLIERFHYMLKSGCQIERLQLETAGRLCNAIATFSVVAWRIMWLAYLARSQPDLPCDQVLPKEQWQALYCHRKKTRHLPDQVPTIGEAIRWIAMLGGFLGRKHDGQPGLKSIWCGMARLVAMGEIWYFVQPPDTYG